MIEAWSEEQRSALRAFREAIALRARREEEISSGIAERIRQADQEFHQARETLRESLSQAQTQLEARITQQRQDVEDSHEAA